MTAVDIGQVLVEVDQELGQVFGSGTAFPQPGSANGDMLGASPYYWGNNVVRINRSLGWPITNPNAPASVFGWTDAVSAAIPAIAYSIELTTAHLRDSILGLEQYATDAAKFFASLAAGAATSGTAGANSYAQTLFNQAVAHSDAEFRQAESDLATWATALVTADRTIEANLAGSIANTSAADRSYADAKFGQAESDIGTWATALVASDRTIEANLSAAIDAKFGQAETDLATWAGALVQSDRNIETNLAGLVENRFTQAETDLQTALQTQVQPQIDRLKTEVDQCLAPLCDEVTPNHDTLGKLGKALTAAKGLGIAALFIGLAAEAYADPQGSADAINDALGWTTDVAVEVESAVMG